jgi:hypothetical protein
MNEQKGVPLKFPEPRPIELEASRQRTGHYAGIHPEDRPRLTDERHPRRFSQREPGDGYDTEDVADGASSVSSMPRSARRYAPPTPAPAQPRTSIRVQHHRASAPPARTQEYPQPRTRPQQLSVSVQHQRFHWSVYAGVGMLACLMLVLAGNIGLSWFQVKRDDLTYGYPRTYQTDAVVGHDDSPTHPSHFVAINLNGRTTIIEFPGDDPTRATIIAGPTDVNPNAALDPVTLTFKDVNGDGKPDMIVTINGTNRVVYINDHGTFRPLKPGESVNL